MGVPAGSTSQQQLVWTTPNDVTAALENSCSSPVPGECLQPPPRSSSFCGQVLMASLPQWKTCVPGTFSDGVAFSRGASFRHGFSVDFGTFSPGGAPPELPGGAQVRLGGARGAQVRFFIDFYSIVGSISGGIFGHVAHFSASTFGAFFPTPPDTHF